MCANKHSDNWLTCTCLCWPCLTDSSVSRRKHIKHTCTLVLHNMCNNIEHTGSNAIQTWLLNSICFDISNFRHCLTFFQSPFHISLMVLVCYRSQTIIQLRMNFTTRFAFQCQGMRLLKAHRAQKLASWQTGFSPSLIPFPKEFSFALLLVKQLLNTILSWKLWLTTWAPPCSFAITTKILFSLFSSTYLYA